MLTIRWKAERGASLQQASNGYKIVKKLTTWLSKLPTSLMRLDLGIISGRWHLILKRTSRIRITSEFSRSILSDRHLQLLEQYFLLSFISLQYSNQAGQNLLASPHLRKPDIKKIREYLTFWYTNVVYYKLSIQTIAGWIKIPNTTSGWNWTCRIIFAYVPNYFCRIWIETCCCTTKMTRIVSIVPAIKRVMDSDCLVFVTLQINRGVMLTTFNCAQPCRSC